MFPFSKVLKGKHIMEVSKGSDEVVSSSAILPVAIGAVALLIAAVQAVALSKRNKIKRLTNNSEGENSDKCKELVGKPGLEKKGSSAEEKILSDSSPTVSHVLIRVTDIEKSKRFYTDLGFIHVSSTSPIESSATSPNVAVLKSPTPQDQPYLVLEQRSPERRQAEPNSSSSTASTESTNPRHCADVGYARMCFLVPNAAKEVERLRKLGYDSITEPVTDRPGSVDEKTGKNSNPPVTIVSYYDPDHNIVELVTMEDVKLKCFFKLLQVFNAVKFPIWVHVNINVTSYIKSWDAYQKLGFQMNVDYGRVVNNLYKALKIPSPGIAKYVSLIQFQKDVNRFSIDLIEWEDPKTISTKIDADPSMCVAIDVKDISRVVDLITKSKDSPWKLTSTPKCVNLPSPLGSVVQVKVEDRDGTEIILQSNTKQFFEKQTKKVLDKFTTPSKSKSVLVTGCDSGFGRSLSVHLSCIGFHVISVCYTPEGASYLSDIADTVVADLSIDAGLEKTIQFTKEVVELKKSQLWGVVNNAAMAHPGHVEWVDPSYYKKVMNLNFHAPVSLIHHLLPLLKEQCKGRAHMEKEGTKRIINVTSVCGFTSAPTNSVYSSSKFAMEALSDALRVEIWNYGIDVIVMQPTTMRTPLGTGWAKQWKENYDIADKLKKSNHSVEAAVSFAKSSHEILDNDAEDMMITVKSMVNAFIAPDPPSRMLCGKGAKNHKIISYLPVKWRDAVYKTFIVQTSGLEDE